LGEAHFLIRTEYRAVDILLILCLVAVAVDVSRGAATIRALIKNVHEVP
jgi:hypothetical protein